MQDSTLYDAYLGLGTYKYYLSHFNRHFSWLPFVENSREEGIQLIKKAISGSRFSKYSAMNGISWILMEEGRYEEGLYVVNEVLNEFPDSRVFLWCAAKLHTKMGNWREAATIYDRILASLAADGISSPVNEVTCRRHLSQLYRELQEHQKAQQQCQAVQTISLTEDQRRKCAEALAEISESCTKTAHWTGAGE